MLCASDNEQEWRPSATSSRQCTTNSAVPKNVGGRSKRLMMRALLSPSAEDSFKPPAAQGASMTAPHVLAWQNHGRCCAHLHVPQKCSTSEPREGLQCSLYHPPCSCIPPCWLPSFEYCRRLLLRIVCPDLAAGAVVHLRVAAQPSGNVYVLALQSSRTMRCSVCSQPCAGGMQDTDGCCMLSGDTTSFSATGAECCTPW